MQRYDYDLGHFSATAGQLGRLQTLSVIPVVAGDTLSIDMDAALRLSPLRMPMTLDAKVEFCVFYDKYRHVYDELWVDMIKEGINQSTSIELPSYDINRWSEYPLEYLGGNGNISSGNSTVKKHYVASYNRIWNEYFRIPNVSGPYDEEYVIGEDIPQTAYYPPDVNSNGVVTKQELHNYVASQVSNFYSATQDGDSWLDNPANEGHPNRQIQTGYIAGLNTWLRDVCNTTFQVPVEWALWSADELSKQMQEERRYGRRCARLPQQWNTGLPEYSYTNDQFGSVDTSGGSFDLLDVAQATAQMKTEIDRDWFTKRYRDHIGDTFGAGGISIDADQRPELLLHDSVHLSGYDVDLTSLDGAGQTTGKSAGMFKIQMPNKYFNEHGTVWVMCLVRFPAIMQQDEHYLANNTLDYKTISGDPRVIDVMPPLDYSVGDVTSIQDNTVIGMRSFADWYRWQPNRIHNDFHDEMIFNDSQSGDGYPFIDGDQINWTNQNEIAYDAHQENGLNGYDGYFQSTRLGHWNCVARINAAAKRIIPPASKSINAGV